MTDAPDVAAAGAPLAIIAGGGKVPLIVADAARRLGRPTLVLGIVGEADSGIEAFPHAWLKWGEIGRMFDMVARHGAREVVLVGAITRRPDFTSIRLDFGAIRSLPEILSIVIGGDDTVLTGTVRFFEARGLAIVGAHEIALGLSPRAARSAACRPAARTRAMSPPPWKRPAPSAVSTSVRRRLPLAAAPSRSRVSREPTGSSPASPTCACRPAVLKGKAGVLAKCAKPQQDLRVDMPAIGVRTVEAIAAAGLAGIVVEAGRVMIVDRPEVVAAPMPPASLFAVSPVRRTGEGSLMLHVFMVVGEEWAISSAPG
ncbi:MAG: UDP-2,3-diacylglucosamine diphosphatase LpxI [Hyphomicrobiales bacterium]